MIVMPLMPSQQQRVWHCLFRISERLPGGWALIGGQMVHVHCAERGAEPHRTTTDGDAVVDIRADPTMLTKFTHELVQLGFTSTVFQPKATSTGGAMGSQSSRFSSPRT